MERNEIMRRLKSNPVKTIKGSLLDLEKVPNGVKYVAIIRHYFSNGLTDSFVNIRTEDNRFISYEFDTSEGPITLANLVIEKFNKGELKPQNKKNIVKGLDQFVENGVFELKGASGKNIAFYYYV